MRLSLPAEIGTAISALAQKAGILGDAAGNWEGWAGDVSLLQGDGSARRFWRLTLPFGGSIVALAPAPGDAKGLREAASVWNIGRHLWQLGVPVPELHGFDESLGLLLCEDLGDEQLHGVVTATDFTDKSSVERLSALYRQVLDVLVAMQCRGATNFDPAWCWDTPHYDRKLMLERESGYFLSACWQGVLGRQVPDGLTVEFVALAEVASRAPAGYFLHRDFQSRNIMIQEARVRVIDFQGGRLGPLGYDLASLLLDPYAALPSWLREELFAYYLKRLELETAVDIDRFQSCYQALELQRNLQIVGAFSYLSEVCDKPFFRSYLVPALASLHQLARRSSRPYMPVLASTAELALLQLKADGAQADKGGGE